jgi:hypothetical protein
MIVSFDVGLSGKNVHGVGDLGRRAAAGRDPAACRRKSPIL